MNKTLFKRSLATATGALLAFGQTVSTLGVVTAANASLTIDKNFILDAEIDTKALPALPAEVAAPEYAFATAVKIGESDWNNDVDSFLSTTAADGDVTKEVSLDAAKDLLESAIAKTKKLDDELIQNVIDNVSDATAVYSKNAITVSAKLNDIGQIIAPKMVELINKSGGNLAGNFDFSKFEISGSVEAVVDFGEFDKNIDVTVTFTDEAGKKYTVANDREDIFDYTGKKYNELVDIAKAQADLGIVEANIKKCQDAIANTVEYMKNVDAALAKVSFSGTSFDGTYEGYAKAALAAIKSVDDSKLLDAATTYRDKAIAKIPASWQDGLTDERTQKGYDALANLLAEFNCTLSLTTDDIISIAADADANNEVKIDINGYNIDGSFVIERGANADALAACQEAWSDDLAAKNLALTGVDTHKLVEFSEEGAELAYYNVTLFIDKLYFEEIPETTTTTTETTTTSTETTTTSTETTSTSTETTTTSTETTSTSTETTTTSTETTTTSTETTTTSTETTTTSTDTTTSTSETTTTTAAVQINFDFAAEDGRIGYYWTEETTKFAGVDAFKVVMNVYKDGTLIGEEISLDPSYFVLGATSVADLKDIDPLKYYAKYDIPVTLTDEGVEAINAKLAEVGSDEKVEAGKNVSNLYVTLVQRGNSMFDDGGEIFAADATAALKYYVYTNSGIMAQNYMRQSVQVCLPASVTDYAGVYYAMDVDANGVIDASDATAILQYYVYNTVMSVEGSTVSRTFDQLTKTEDVHEEVMHKNPFYIIETWDQNKTAPIEENTEA